VNFKNWNEDKKTGPVLLQVIFEDAGLKARSKIKVRLRVADNEKKNVNFPDCPLFFHLDQRKYRIAFTFMKIDPNKDDWGDITIEVVDVKGPKQSPLRQNPPSLMISRINP